MPSEASEHRPYCPFLSMAAGFAHALHKPVDEPCLEQRCAIWNEEDKRCGLIAPLPMYEEGWIGDLELNCPRRTLHEILSFPDSTYGYTKSEELRICSTLGQSIFVRVVDTDRWYLREKQRPLGVLP